MWIPLLMIGGVIGQFFVSKAADSASSYVTGIPQSTTSTNPILPSWVVPTALVVVGGLLLYKKGASILKV